jgi:hypothetical protein
VQQAEMLPLDMYLMIDRSLSMIEDTSVAGTTKWDAVVQALTAFANDGDSVGIGVGLQYFPPNSPCTSNDQCGASYCYLSACNNVPSPQPCQSDADCPGQVVDSCAPIGRCGSSTCTNVGGLCGGTTDCVAVTSSVCAMDDFCPVELYSDPAVALELLPDVSPALVSSLGSMAPAPLPYGFTPMGPALQGAVDYAKSYTTANPTHTVIAVLATDGLPTRCAPSSSSGLAAIAGVAAQTAPAVRTFTIGVFAQDDTEGQATMQAIADAGQGQAFVIDPNENVAEQFIAALNAIRGSALACEFDLPDPPDGQDLDFAKVNVVYTDGEGIETTLLYVENLEGCDPTAGGWYYDVDPAGGGTPTKVIVCPATCDEFKQSLGGEVSIAVGCATVVPR